jgi:tetratricopeptide (TPR) repeat protein
MRRSARIAIVTATIAIVANTGEARGQDELLAEGRRAFEREEYALARETLWKYLDATANLSGAAAMPQAEALYYIAVMEPDASVANRHYEIIVDEFPAASVADQALYRLALFELATGRPADARGRFERLQREYPFSPSQPELPLLIGRTHMTEGNPTDAIASFEDGFRRVKAQDLPREMPRAVDARLPVVAAGLRGQRDLGVVTGWWRGGGRRAARRRDRRRRRGRCTN